MLSASPAKSSLLLMNPQEQLEAKLKRGVKFLSRFYPNSSQSELNEVLQKCNLDEQKAFDVLVNDSFNGHKERTMQRVQPVESKGHFLSNSAANSPTYGVVSGQSMQSFMQTQT